jgi:hypothetical protein
MSDLAIQIPAGLATGTAAVAGAQISNLQNYMLLIGGALLAVVMVEILIHAIRPK